MPERTARDHARTAGDAVVAGVPFVGGSLGVLLGEVVRPSYQKRVDAWLVELGEVVERLESDSDNFEWKSLEDNELFVSAVVHATEIALGTALEDKIEMLKSGLANIATGEMSDDFLAMRFLTFVEELTPEHFYVLAYSVDPAPSNSSWGPEDKATPRSLIDLSDLEVKPSIVDLIIADLASRSLIDTSTLSKTAAGDDALTSFATSLGRQLIKFVEVI